MQAMGPATFLTALLAVDSAANSAQANYHITTGDASSRGAASWRVYRPPEKVRQHDK